MNHILHIFINNFVTDYIVYIHNKNSGEHIKHL